MTQAIYFPDQDEISRQDLERALNQMYPDDSPTKTDIIKQAIIESTILTEEIKHTLLEEIEDKSKNGIEKIQKAWGISRSLLEQILENISSNAKLVEVGYLESEMEGYYQNELTEQCFSVTKGFSRESLRDALLDNVNWNGVVRDLLDETEEYRIGGHIFLVMEGD